MKNFKYFFAILLVVILATVSNLSAREFYISGLEEGLDFNQEVKVQKVIGCYISNRDKDLAWKRAEIIADYLKTLGVEVNELSIARDGRGQVKIIYDFDVIKVLGPKTSKPIMILNWLEDGANYVIDIVAPKSADKSSRMIILLVELFFVIIFLLIVIKKIKRTISNWSVGFKGRQKIRKTNRQERWDAKQKADLEAYKEKIKLQASRKKRKESLINEREQILLDAEKLELTQAKKDLSEEKRVAVIEKFSVPQQTDFSPWPATVGEIRVLQSLDKANPAEKRLCPHCVARLKAQCANGQITEEFMYDQIGKLAPVMLKNILSHFGKHGIHEDFQANEDNQNNSTSFAS